MDSNLDKRLATAYAKANGTKRDMLNSFIAVGIDSATARAQQFAVPELNRQYAEGYNIKKQNHMRTNEVPNKVAQQTEFGNRVWVHGDVAKTRMQEDLNTNLARGMTKYDFSRLTRVIPQSGERTDNNLSTDMNQLLSRMHTLMRDSGVVNSNSGYEQANADNPSDIYIYCKWNTQHDDRVCDVCAPLDGQIWPWDEAPVPITDTHDGCRCWRARCDQDGNIDPDDDYSNPYAA